MRRVINRAAGVTLVEMVVAIGLFLIVSVVVVDIYLLLARAQGSLRRQSFVTNEATRLFEEIVLATRTGRINYAGYPPNMPLSDSELHIVDQEGVGRSWRIVDVASDVGCASDAATPCLQRCIQGAGCEIISRSDVRIERGRFEVAPVGDPFVRDAQGQYAHDGQPRVTILLEVAPAVASPGVILHNAVLQTTVSPRFYAR